jgi:hypothetical protein
MFKTLHEAKATARLEALKKREIPVNDETPKAEQSQHAADHVEGVMDAMDAVFGEVKTAAAEVVAKLRAEGDELKGNMRLFDERVVGRMRAVNSRFRNFIGGNGGPPIEDAVVIASDSPKALPKE